MDHLWRIDYKDGTTQKVSAVVANMMRTAILKGDKFVSSPTRTLSVYEIKNIEETSELDVDGATLLVAGESALSKGQPIETKLDTGELAIKSMEVKKKVTNREYSSYYAKHHGYRTVESDASGVTIAFTRPSHLGIPSGCQLV